MLQAGLLQQGYGNAQNAAQQAFQNQQAMQQAQSRIRHSSLGLGREQMNLSNFQRAGHGCRRWRSRTTWKFKTRTRHKLKIKQLNNKRHQTAAYEPYGRLSQYGQGITGLTGGVAAAQYAQPQQASPMSSALSTALGVGGLYQKMFHPQPMFGTIG